MLVSEEKISAMVCGRFYKRCVCGVGTIEAASCYIVKKT